MKLNELIKFIYIPMILLVIIIGCNENVPTEYIDLNPADKQPPVIKKITPSEAFLKDTVTIIGTGFNPLVEYNSVLFGNKVGQIVSATVTELKVVLPSLSGDTVKVKASVKGAVEWSSGIDFTFKNTISIISEDIPNTWGIAVDKNNNIYVGSIDDKTIYKITPEGTKSVFVENISVNGAIHFGPDNYLYVCEQDDWKIVRVSSDGKIVEDYVAVNQPVDFDWDNSGKLHVVANWEGIYSQNTDGTFTLTVENGNYITMRIFNNKLYTASSWEGQIHIYDVTENGFENQTIVEAGETVMGLEVDAQNKLYYSRYWTPTLFTVDADGKESTLYDDQIKNPIRFMTWSDKVLYVIVDGGVDGVSGENGIIMSLYIGVSGAPRFGVN